MSAQLTSQHNKDLERLQMLEKKCKEFEITPDETISLRNTERTVDRIFIIDNSGSMNDPEQDLQPGMGLFDSIPSKWSIVYGMTQDLVTMASCVDRNGVKIYFLNQISPLPVDPTTGGMTLECAGRDIGLDYIPDNDIDPYFNANEGVPLGHTPINEVYEGAVKHTFSQLDGSKQLYVTIITDGEPTSRNGDTHGENDKFKQTLKKLHKKYTGRLYTQIISVTNETRVLNYLKSLDDGIPGVDVTPDFSTFKSTVQKARGKTFPVTKGLYYLKCLCGPMDKKLDNVDKWHLFG